MNTKKTILICTLILLAAGTLTLLIFLTEPKAKRGGAMKKTAMLVEVIPVTKGDYHPTIRAMGTVTASCEIETAPRINGEVRSLGRNFMPGGFVKKGEILLQIDEADYINTLQQRKSQLEQALADLHLEMGRQKAAQKDYQLLAEKRLPEQEALMLRHPQLNTARAKVDAAKAALLQAELELQRTTIKAPFNALVLSREVNVGSQVSRGQNIARLAGMDTYWITTAVAPAKLRWLSFPGQNQNTLNHTATAATHQSEPPQGSPVTILNRTAWGAERTRTGHLFRLVGELDDKTRLARLLITVQDPLALQKNSQGLPPLMLGTFVETRITGETIPNVVRLKREYLRKNNTVWVMKERKLHIQPVEVVFRDQTYAYIGTGLTGGEEVVITNLATVVEGTGLRLQTDIPTNTSQDTSQDTSQNTSQNESINASGETKK